MTEFLTSPYVQAVAWPAAGAIAYRLPAYLRDGGRVWSLIAAGSLVYAIRAGVKLVPFYSAQPLWPDLIRHGLGIAAIGLIVLGLLEDFAHQLRSHELGLSVLRPVRGLAR